MALHQLLVSHMERITRRDALRSAAAAGAPAIVAAMTSATLTAQSVGQTGAAQQEAIRKGILAAAAVADRCEWSDAEQKERERVMSIGFTADEASCWLLVNRAAAKFLTLPELHPSDVPELTVVFHSLQFKLMSRPTYRKYRESMNNEQRPR